MSDITVKKNEQAGQYEGFVDGEQVGFTVYRPTGDAIEMPHTVVPEQFGGRGYAGAIVQVALDDIRAQGKKVVPSCPYVDAWITKHPEYADLRA